MPLPPLFPEAFKRLFETLEEALLYLGIYEIRLCQPGFYARRQPGVFWAKLKKIWLDLRDLYLAGADEYVIEIEFPRPPKPPPRPKRAPSKPKPHLSFLPPANPRTPPNWLPRRPREPVSLDRLFTRAELLRKLMQETAEQREARMRNIARAQARRTLRRIEAEMAPPPPEPPRPRVTLLAPPGWRPPPWWPSG